MPTPVVQKRQNSNCKPHHAHPRHLLDILCASVFSVERGLACPYEFTHLRAVLAAQTKTDTDKGKADDERGRSRERRPKQNQSPTISGATSVLDPLQGRGQDFELGVKAAPPQTVQGYRGYRAGKHVENNIALSKGDAEAAY